MSRLAKQPLTIPSGVTVAQQGDVVTVKGPKGELSREFRKEIGIVLEENAIVFILTAEDVFTRSLWGTTASHMRNMIKGVTEGYEKKLEIEGVGYRWEVKNDNVEMSIGFSHQVRIPIPQGIAVKAEAQQLTITGINKELVGEFAAKIRAKKKPEPYKGKGIRYKGEHIRRKQGKRTA
jgi:large subunit ribosomal protein L6